MMKLKKIKKIYKKTKFNSCEHLKLMTMVMRWGLIAYKEKKNNKAKISIKNYQGLKLKKINEKRKKEKI